MKTFDLFTGAQYLQFVVIQSCTGFLYTNPFCPRVLVLNSALKVIEKFFFLF